MSELSCVCKNNASKQGYFATKVLCTKIGKSPAGNLCMKKIGFLSFGHWTSSPQSGTQSAADALLQSIDLAVEAERLGM
ncbi:MAG TPA: LLM class flavin-dependent oxidoreductase, partial [Edaphobacter sp.]